MVSPCSPDCPRTCYVEQAGLNSRDFPASASPTLGSRVCTTDVFTRFTIRFGIGWNAPVPHSVSSSFPPTQHTPCDLAIPASGSQPPCL